ncbi:MAG: hypothetical protein RIT06_121 [Chloroflexota bacterium]
MLMLPTLLRVVAGDITDASNRLKQGWICRIHFDEFAQRMHMYVNGAGLAGIVGTPHAGEQLFAREDLPPVLKEECKQLEGSGF